MNTAGVRKLWEATKREGWWCQDCKHAERFGVNGTITKTCMASGPMQCLGVLSVLVGGNSSDEIPSG